MVYGFIKMKTAICHSSPDDIIEPQMWLIVKSATELSLLVITVTCDCCCDTFTLVTSWLLSLFYMVWVFVGANMAFDNCFLLGFNIDGSIFILFTISVGIIISYRNIFIIDKMYNRRVERNNYLLPIYNAYRE
jgi:hypothetical protein